MADSQAETLPEPVGQNERNWSDLNLEATSLKLVLNPS